MYNWLLQLMKLYKPRMWKTEIQKKARIYAGIENENELHHIIRKRKQTSMMIHLFTSPIIILMFGPKAQLKVECCALATWTSVENSSFLLP